LGDDVYPTASFADKVIEIFSKNEKIGVIDFSLYDTKTKKNLLWERRSKQPIDFCNAEFAVRRLVWEKVGHFPSFSPARTLTIEFSIRLLSAGYRILHLPSVVFHHNTTHDRRKPLS
jgi:GT2 family glycosyltransferase